MPDDTEYLLVSEYFHPDTATTGQLMTDLAVGLQERGLDMTVYTGQPNYHSGDNEKQQRVSTHEGVLVKRLRAPQLRQTSLSRRLFNWAVFTVWMSVALLLYRSEGDTELVFVSNPPVLPVAMWLVATLRGWDYTYVVHDLYPDQPVELGYLEREGVADRVWTWLNNRAVEGANRIVALGPVMKERIVENTGGSVDPEKIAIIHNWEDETFIEPKDPADNWFSRDHDLVDPLTLLYSGNIGEFHDLETLLRAMKELEDEDVQLLIIGEGDNKDTIVSLAESLGLRGSTVSFLPYQPVEDLPYSLTAGDVSVVTVEDGFEGVCVSSKLYTALAAGCPVLGIAKPHDDEGRIVEAFDAGTAVPQGDVEGVVSAIRTWLDEPETVAQQGENAREALERHFTREESIDAYYDLLTGNAVPDDPVTSAA